jgi:hypothetical protein
MNKIVVLGVCLLLFSACKEDKVQVAEANDSDFIIPTEGWPKKTIINAKATEIIATWPEFNAMDASFDALYNVANREDLILVIENMIEAQKNLEASFYPIPFDKPQVRSRQKVVKTYILKTKGNLEYRLDTEEPIVQTIEAYNALRNQFNVIVNNTLDTKLILNEK